MQIAIGLVFLHPLIARDYKVRHLQKSSNLFIVVPAKETPQGSKETSETSDDNGKETEPDSSAEDWDKKFLESFQKLRNTLTKKLTQLALKPPGEVFMVDSFQVAQCS